MLDDLKMIHFRDSQDTLGVLEHQSQQLTDQLLLPERGLLQGGDSGRGSEPVRNIVFAGMGGSALSAMIVQTWLDMSLPFEIVRDYSLPAYVGSGTLCILASYSGNTEETVSAFKQARTSGAQLVVISHGGELRELATQAGVPFVGLPEAKQPRFATWLAVRAIVAVLEVYGVVQDKITELTAQQSWFAAQAARWRPDVATSQNKAKQIALELAGKSVVIYSGPALWPGAYGWKLAINENAKQIAWAGQYPEFNHNEFSGWTRQPVHKPYGVIELQSTLEHPRVQERFAASERLLSGVRPAPTLVDVEGDTILQQLLFTSLLGNFVSVYLAVLSGTDPSSSQIVDKLKKELA